MRVRLCAVGLVVAVGIAAGVATGIAHAAPDPDSTRWRAASDDFAAELLLVPDPTAFVRMWAKPAPPIVRILSTTEIDTPLSAVVIYRGGHADAAGRCDLVSRLTIAESDGHVVEDTGAQPVCSGHAPGRLETFMLGESAFTFVPTGAPRSVVVAATVTDRTTGKSVVVSTPLALVAKGSLFRFESVRSLDDMQALIRRRFALGADLASVRQLFVTDGRATLVRHPTQPGVEKYLYDIDLCGYYVWRWNISADYDEHGALRQAYVNGDIVFANGTPKRGLPGTPPGKKGTISRMSRPRPEAAKGESVLEYLQYDSDGDPSTIDDRLAMGAGPTQADPMDSGRLVVYNVDPWRSIFDADRAEPIARFPGNCDAVDAAYDAKYHGARGPSATSAVVDRLVKSITPPTPTGEAATRPQEVPR